MPYKPRMRSDASLFERYGDRTNSLLLLYPGFSTFPDEQDGEQALRDGRLFYQETSRARIIASEPLAPPERRAELIARFAAASSKPVTVFPVGEALAQELKGRGFTVRQVGAEPIFDLEQYFGLPVDPLVFSPLARTLSKRGGEVAEICWESLDADAALRLRAEMESIAQAWLSSKSCLPLGFLSSPQPFAQFERKKYFTLRVRGELQAFIAAAPFYRDGRILGYYFADIARAPAAKAGANDLLILESLRLLHAQQIPEARLGMAPLARLNADAPALFAWLFEHWSLGYTFKSLAEYKDKFAPTRWAPLSMASTTPGLSAAFRDVLQAHFPEGVGRAALCVGRRSWGEHLALTPPARRAFAPEGSLAPKSLGDYFWRTKFTSVLVLFFIGLHLARLLSPELAVWFERSAYIPGAITWRGVFLGPLFHNHWFHLIGDQLSLYMFGALCELTFGPLFFWIVIASGLWLSNPLTQLCYQPWLPTVWPKAWSYLLLEPDYGSSNAVFAVVGAYCAVLARKSWLLTPFLIYGAFICFARNSLIALHHPLSMLLGYVLALGWVAWKNRDRTPPRA